MSKFLGNTPFSDIVTHSIRDDKTIDKIAKSLDSILNPSIRSIPKLLIFARLAHDGKFIDPVPMLKAMERLSALNGGLDALELELLDYLAWQFHVDGYGQALTLQAKREMIYQSVILHKYKGTPWSVKHAVNTALNFPVELTEWFQYGGDPYFFRVHIDITEMIFDLDIIENIFRIIWDYKNTRSWLEYLETKNTIKQEVHTGLVLAGRQNHTCYLFFPIPEITSKKTYTGMAITGHIKTKLTFLEAS